MKTVLNWMVGISGGLFVLLCFWGAIITYLRTENGLMSSLFILIGLLMLAGICEAVEEVYLID